MSLADLRRTVIAPYRGGMRVNGMPHGDGATAGCRLCELEIGEGEQVYWEDVGRGTITLGHAVCAIRASGQKVGELRGLLRRMEWITLPDRPEPFCPACTHPQSSGHLDLCWLAVELWRGVLS
jgi:hypothetical protein